jgi:DNA-binding NtrC family response regulator
MKLVKPEIWSLVQDGEIAELIADMAGSEGLALRRLSSVAEALGGEEPSGGFVLCIDATGKFNNYMTIIKRFQKNFFSFDVVVLGESKPDGVVEREREIGVDLYCSVPVDNEEFIAKLAHIVSLRRLKSAASIIGRSRQLNEMLETVLQVAPTEVPVLIQGESGSGKELTAKAIHMTSSRSDRPFEAVNCGALAEGVLESELFGHERGSFTGAVSRRIGLFERANGGTLFLDEVGEMSLNMQVRLLRVIETGDFLRVGGTERIHTDVRLIAATNRELEASVERGDFRRDLYYRLKVVQVTIPPLRARRDDIPLLASYFVSRSSRKHGRAVRGIDRKGIELFLDYPWPGNVRELSNVIDNLTVLGTDALIRAEDIEKRLRETRADRVLPDLPVHVEKSREQMERELILNSLLSLNNDIKEILRILKGERQHGSRRWGKWVEVEEADADQPRKLDTIEREAIQEALIANGGNRRRTARQLGISERTLYRRLKEYDLT